MADRSTRAVLVRQGEAAHDESVDDDCDETERNYCPVTRLQQRHPRLGANEATEAKFNTCVHYCNTLTCLLMLRNRGTVCQ